MNSIQWKITAPFFLLFMVVVIVQSLFSWSLLNRTAGYSNALLEEQLNEKQGYVGKSITNKLELMLNEAYLTAKELATHPDMPVILASGQSNAAETFLAGRVKKHQSVWMIRSVDVVPEQRYPVFTGNKGYERKKGSPVWYYNEWYNHSRYGIALKSIGIAAYGDVRYFAKEPVYDSQNRVIGEVCVELAVNTEFLNSLSSATNTADGVFVATGSGDFTVLTDAGADEIGRLMSRNSIEQRMESAPSLTRLAAEDADYEQIAAILQGVVESRQETNMIREIGGVPYALYVKPLLFVQGKPAVILFSRFSGYTASRQDIVNHTTALQQMSYMVAGALALLCMLLCILIAERVTSPLRRLNRAIRRIGEGDFTSRLNVRGRDEISQIARTINWLLNRFDELIREVYLVGMEKKEKELQVLQAQINPHFLYNTLSAISRLGKLGEIDKMHRMVLGLARFYRLTLNEGKAIIPIEKEIEQIKTYVEIQNEKYGERMLVTYHIDPDALQYDTIKLILQPFVENALEHAWEGDRIHIRIEAYCENEIIYFQIADDGCGMSEELVQQIMEPELHPIGYGIRNVHERVRLQFGEPYGVTIYSKPGAGTKVFITVPKYKEEEGKQLVQSTAGR